MRVEEEDPHRRPQLNWDFSQKKKEKKRLSTNKTSFDVESQCHRYTISRKWKNFQINSAKIKFSNTELLLFS